MIMKIIKQNENSIDDFVSFTAIRMKSCTQCGEMLPATNEYFHKSKHTRDGLRWECKECVSKKDRERDIKKRRGNYHHLINLLT